MTDATIAPDNTPIPTLPPEKVRGAALTVCRCCTLKTCEQCGTEFLLKMERDEMVDTVIESHFDATKRKGAQLTRTPQNHRYLVANNSDREGFFLVWDGPTGNTDITEAVYEQIVAEAVGAGLSQAVYHVYARLWIYQSDDVRFIQIPDRILADFGLDARNEPFADADHDQWAARRFCTVACSRAAIEAVAG